MIAQHGAESVTMRALSSRLGVSRTALYRHFPDKSALLVGVAAAGFKRLKERMQSIDGGAGRSSVTGLRRLGAAYVGFAIENPTHYRLMYGKEALSREYRPELKEAANTLFEQIVGMIRAHQRSGTIKHQDYRAQAYVAWSALHGLASLLIEGQIMAPVDVDVLVRQMTGTLLDGMRPRHRAAG